MDQFDLSTFCHTKAEARDFASRVATLSDAVYRTDFHLETALARIFGLQKKDALLNLMRTSGRTFTTPADFKNFLSSLQSQLNSLPVLSLSLAFEPTDATLKLLTDWFLLNSNRHVLFEISVDPTLIAGVAIRYNGRYVEYSVKPTLQRIIAEALTKPAPPEKATPPTRIVHQSIESMSLGR